MTFQLQGDVLRKNIIMTSSEETACFDALNKLSDSLMVKSCGGLRKRWWSNGPIIPLSISGYHNQYTISYPSKPIRSRVNAIPCDESETANNIQVNSKFDCSNRIDPTIVQEDMNEHFNKEWQLSVPFSDTSIARVLNCLMERIKDEEKEWKRAIERFNDGMCKQYVVDKIQHTLEQDKAMCKALAGINPALAQICDIVPSNELIAGISIRCAAKYEFVNTDEPAHFTRANDGNIDVEFVKPLNAE